MCLIITSHLYYYESVNVLLFYSFCSLRLFSWGWLSSLICLFSVSVILCVAGWNRELVLCEFFSFSCSLHFGACLMTGRALLLPRYLPSILFSVKYVIKKILLPCHLENGIILLIVQESVQIFSHKTDTIIWSFNKDYCLYCSIYSDGLNSIWELVLKSWSRY